MRNEELGMVVRRINSYSAAFYILGGYGRSYV